MHIPETLGHELFGIAGVQILVRHTASHHLITFLLGDCSVSVMDGGVELRLFLAIFEGLFVVPVVRCHLVTGRPLLSGRSLLGSEAVTSLVRCSGWAELDIELFPFLIVSWTVIIDRRFRLMWRPVVGRVALVCRVNVVWMHGCSVPVAMVCGVSW